MNFHKKKKGLKTKYTEPFSFYSIKTLTQIMCKYFPDILKSIQGCVPLSNEGYWTTDTSEHTELIVIRVHFCSALNGKHMGCVMIYTISIVILRAAAFPLCMADSWCLSGNNCIQSQTTAQTSCDAKLLCALRCSIAVTPLMWSILEKKAQFEGCLQNYILACTLQRRYPSLLHFKLSPGHET